MNKCIIIMLSALLFSCNNYAQNHTSSDTDKTPANFEITDKTIKKDPNGNVISNEKFEELMKSNKYIYVPKVENGKTKEVRLQEPTSEQLAMLEKMMQESEATGQDAPDFDVVDMKGKHFRLQDLKNKTVVLNFWYTGCIPCVKEIPSLNKLVENNKDVVFISFAKDTKEKVKIFIQKHPFYYNIVTDAEAIAKAYNVSGYPTNIVIKNGKIAFRKLGFSTDIKAELQKGIENSNATTATQKNTENQSKKTIMLSSDSDIRDESGNKLDMMATVERINSGKYSMEQVTDKSGHIYILLKKK